MAAQEKSSDRAADVQEPPDGALEGTRVTTDSSSQKRKIRYDCGDLHSRLRLVDGHGTRP